MTWQDTPVRRRTELAWLAALVLLLTGLFTYMVPTSGRCDEPDHMDQILRFVRGERTLNPALTTVPGFHALLALVARVTGARSVEALRLVHFLVALGSLAAFVACSRLLTPDRVAVRTWRHALLPILTPFFFLLYTDVTSLLCVLLALHATLSARYGRAAVFAALSVLVRQNNILWVFFFFAVFLLQTRPPPDGASPWRLGDEVRRLWARRADGTRRLLPTAIYALVFVGFLVFVRLNGGVAVGAQGAHPLASLHATNVYFLLILHFLFFLPDHLGNAGRIRALLGRHPTTWLVIVCGVPLFLLTFTNTHPLNHGSVQDLFFLRNRLLDVVVGPLPNRLISYAVIVYTALSLGVTGLVRREYALIYPVTALYLMPSWLVEQRYYLVPITLHTLLRPPASPRQEAAVVLWMLPFTAVFLWGIRHELFFL